MRLARSPEVPKRVVNTGVRLFKLLFGLLLLLLLVGTLGRLALLAWQWDRLADLSPTMRWSSLLHGLRMDLILSSFVLLPLAFLLTLAPAWLGGISAWLLRGWALIALMLVVFVEIATFPFFAQYDVRPNLLFVQYLEYPREVAAMLWKEQRGNLIGSALALALLVWVFLRQRAFADAHAVTRARWLHRVVWLLPLVVLLALGIRSSLGHRPANISDALYSSNRVANEVAKSSVYSVAYDFYRARQDGGGKAAKYGELGLDEAYARTAKLLSITTPADPKSPLSRELFVSHPAAKPRNLVIIVQESMGAAFVGHLDKQFLGDKSEHPRGVTPHLDALAAESLTFRQLHANGTRSIGGLAAMSAGFMPVTGEGVLKRSKSQSEFFTLASLLKPLGYHASFIYGGEARFDDMKVWYLGNGFDEVIEQKDFKNPSFVATWGVCDEDLMMKAHERFMALNAQGRPFVSVVFSQSNHAPFELPEGKIEWEPGIPKFSVRNAVKYADYAIDKFFEKAKASPYYRDTVFVVVADHSVRVYGDDAVPVPGFHIPGLVHLAGVAPQNIDKTLSQPDLLATALGMLGVPLRAPVMGNSVFRPERQHFALMQFNDTYGFWRGDEVAVMRPDKPPMTQRYQAGRLVAAPPNTELERDALALIKTTEDLYERRLYR